MTIEIVDFPIENGDFPISYVSLPEGRQAIASGLTLLQLEDFSRAEAKSGCQIGPTMPHNEAEHQELKWCLKAWCTNWTIDFSE